MNEEEYPDLYRSADASSNLYQRYFVASVFIEFAILTVISLYDSYGNLETVWVSLLVFLLAAVFLAKNVLSFDKKWYSSRALAESVKTLTWRFIMRAHPYEDSADVNEAKRKFQSSLKEIVSANQQIASNVNKKGGKQITDEMIAARSMSIKDRLKFYEYNRINNQEDWYTRKANYFSDKYGMWIAIILILCAALIFLITYKEGLLISAFDPILVVIASSLGWLQLKRYNEISATYRLTAHEISLVKEEIAFVNSEQDLSDFVNEAELAFSREHTQWVARKNIV